ncbi:copper resistance protein NlpE N-terminal domain-containing protein [Lysobacter fragariae]
MNRKLLLLALASSVVVLSACKPQAPAEPAAPATEAAPAAEAAPVAAEPMPAEAPAEMPFDIKGFAGTFTGTLPCADCAGVDAKIELAPDGSFKLNEVYQGPKGHTVAFDGTWTAEENGKRVRLDPNSKAEPDRVYAVTSHEQIDQLDADGKTLAVAHTLKRQMQ